MQINHWYACPTCRSLGLVNPPTPPDLMSALETQPLATRANALPGSPLRALLSSASGSARLDLAGGIPDPALFPLQELQAAAARALTDPSSLQYAATEGHLGLREWIAERLVRRGASVSAEDVVITQGAQHALASLAQLAAGPGQMAALEAPAYPGALQAFALASAPIAPLPITEDGWDVSTLPREVNAIYAMPHFQNPSGRSASRRAMEELMAAASARRALIVEDDAYGELSFSGQRKRPILADLPELTALVGSLSKVLAPGLRIGWIVAPRRLRQPLIRVLQATALQPGTFSQSVAAEWLRQANFDGHLQGITTAYQTRAAAACGILREAGLKVREPEGGLFAWAKTPGRAADWCRRMLAEGVLLMPESSFGLGSAWHADAHARVAFSRLVPGGEDSRILRAALAKHAHRIP